MEAQRRENFYPTSKGVYHLSHPLLDFFPLQQSICQKMLPVILMCLSKIPMWGQRVLPVGGIMTTIKVSPHSFDLQLHSVPQATPWSTETRFSAAPAPAGTAILGIHASREKVIPLPTNYSAQACYYSSPNILRQKSIWIYNSTIILIFPSNQKKLKEKKKHCIIC